MSRKSKMPKGYQKTFGHSQLNSHVGKVTKHHVPPKNPDTTPRPKVLYKERRHHEAYHLLFGAPANATEAIRILVRDWWPDEYENFFPL